MLRLVPVDVNLIEATAEELLKTHPRESGDFSTAGLIFPSKRMILFFREELSRRIGSSFFPPQMYTMDEFVKTTFLLNHPGYEVLSDVAAAAAVFDVVQREFDTPIYTGGALPPTFAGFFPWARRLLSAIETLLVEGENLLDVNARIYSEFASLGDYHRGYKEFIIKLPVITRAFLDSLLRSGRCTRGIMYRNLAESAEAGELDVPGIEYPVFSGINALNFAEAKILRYLFQRWPCRLVVRSDPGGLFDPNSPFLMQKRALATLDLLPGDPQESPRWNRFTDRVKLYAVPNTETQMVQASQILQEILSASGTEDDLKRIAVILPDASSLIPFIHGVASRASGKGGPPPFNITLGYPFLRTPLFQLISAMLEVVGSSDDGTVHAGRYLNLIRHPYVKLTAGEEGDAFLRDGIRRIEGFITTNNLLRFNPENLTQSLKEKLQGEGELSPGDVASVSAAITRIHSLFLSPSGTSLTGLTVFIREAVLAIHDAGGNFLFLSEYITTALNILDEILEFSKKRESDADAVEFESAVQLIRHYFSDAQIYFEGSPLKGVQVMGMLESRGLDFDEVIFLDVEEGILPQTRKYDPLLPQDICKIFGVRGYPDWDTLFSFNFFSLLATVKKAHILWIENRGGMEKSERSRFVERILYETERHSGHAPKVLSQNARGRLGVVESGPVKKRDWVVERIRGMTLSPSAMEAYIRCPLRFYYGTVLGLEERPALADDADAGVLGSVIHSVLEKFYRDIELSGSWQDYRSRIDRLLSTEMRCQGFTVETGVRRIRHWATLEKLIDFVRVDVARMREGNVEILDLEKTFEHEFDIPGLDNRLKTRGRIDRIEVEGDVLRLIDYKTGSRFTVSVGRKAEEWRFRSFHLLPEDEYLPALAQLSSAYKNFQLLFYLLLAHHCLDRKFEDLEAVYCFLQHADGFHRPVFAMRGEIDKVKVMERFSEILGDVFRDLCLRERFLPNRSDPHHCGYCPFVGLCGG